MRMGSTHVLVSRLAWFLVCGPVPSGARVVHRCARANCVRPDHLKLELSRGAE